MIKFIFDLDGTLTTVETLPLIAKHFGIDEDIATITQQAIRGLIPFDQSMQKRMRILGDLPVNAVAKLLATVPLYNKLHQFILQNKAHCLIATGNIDAWLTDLAPRLGCEIQCSKAMTENNRITKLLSILDKKDIVHHWQERGYVVIFIGDSDNDVQAMLCADVSIAVGMTHSLAPQVQSAATHVMYTEDEIYDILCQLLAEHTA